MIKINDVSKSYISKTKQRVDALKGVSFELPDTGMVFILGKSGSGKSTLLNLLGGLDAPTEGEIIIDGASMKDFTPTDYDGYRNNYVGFIFQEYNLLDDFNVKDNVALALQLSKEDNIDDKVKNALYQVELNDDYLLRRVGEMSGGEKQRVAIARSIVKDSRMMLADEPTGNLDSATGESIWNILKKVSQTKLVVVVSHDRESAEKYGDRIIEIADGKVLSDSGAELTKNDEKCEKGCEKHEFFDVKKRLSFKACLKMGLNNLAQRKGKTVGVILLSIFTILVLLISEMFIAYSPARTIAKFINRYDVPYFAVQQRKKDEEGGLRYNHILRKDTLDYIDKNCDYIIDGIVESKQQLIDFGFNFVGEALELTSESYYLTSNKLLDGIKFAIEFVNYDNYFIDEDGEIVTITLSTPWEWLIGKRVYLSTLQYREDNLPVLAGIIDSDAINEVARDCIFDQYFREDFEYRIYSSSITVNSETSNAVFQLGDRSYAEKLAILPYLPTNRLFSKSILLTPDRTIDYTTWGEVPIEDDEIVLTFETYAKLFETRYKWYYVDPSTFERLDLADTLEGLGEELDFKIYNEVTGELIADLGRLKLVGIIFQTFAVSDERDANLRMALSEQNFEKLRDPLGLYKTIIIKRDTVSNLSHFLARLSDKYGTRSVRAGRIQFVDDKINRTSDVAELAYDAREIMKSLAFVMIAICAIMIVVLILLVINLISFSISNRKREIGILSALGTSNKDITKIFVFETLIIAAICFVVTLILSFIVAFVFNTIATQDYVEFISLFRVDIFTVAVLAVSSFGLLLLAAWIPTRKIAKLKPIDAIRNV